MNKFAVIGAGKISFSIIPALINAGYIIEQIISKQKEDAISMALKFDIKNCTTEISNVNDEVDIILICVNDSEIKNVASAISKLNFKFDNKLFIHFSGAGTIELLKPIKENNGKVASMHIMQTFPSKDIVNIEDCFCAIETDDDQTKEILKKIAGKLKLNHFEITSENKSLYHLAGVFAVNFLTGNLFITEKLLKEAGINIPAYEVMRSILNTVLKNIENNGVVHSISGPIERADILTIEKHLDKLKSDDEIKLNYIYQSLNLIEAVKERNGNLTEKHKDIQEYLKEKSRE